MSTTLERRSDQSGEIHPEVTGYAVLRGIDGDLRAIERGETIPDFMPGLRFIESFREYMVGLDERDRYALDIHLGKVIDEDLERRLVVAQPEAGSRLLTLDHKSLAIVLGSHVLGMEAKQRDYERRYELHKKTFEVNLSQAVEEKKVPWFAVDGLQNVDNSSPWVFDVPAMTRHSSRRTAAYVQLASREVFLRETKNIGSEQRSTHHEFMHLLSIPPAEEGEEASTWPDFGLYYFPIDGMEQTPHRWLNEAMTEHMNMIVNRYDKGSYEPERALLYAIVRQAGRSVGGRAVQAYYVNQQSQGFDADEIMLRTYRDLSQVTEDAGLGNISQIDAKVSSADSDDLRDAVLRECAYRVDPASRPDKEPYDRAVIDLLDTYSS